MTTSNSNTNPNPNLSRRDWFRLRVPDHNQWLGEANATSQRPEGLQSIDHPPNHDGMNLDELPPLREAMLSMEEVTSLFDDIQRWGSGIQFMQRRATTNGTTNDSPSTLAVAKEAFLNGSLKKVQIRYRWQDSLWIDTLDKQESQTRLVRISHADRFGNTGPGRTSIG